MGGLLLLRFVQLRVALGKMWKFLEHRLLLGRHDSIQLNQYDESGEGILRVRSLIVYGKLLSY